MARRAREPAGRHSPVNFFQLAAGVDPGVTSCLAAWYADLNALHPFREGNGRTQRTFVWLLCTSVGVRVDMSTVTAAGNLAASVAAMNGDGSGFHAALRIAAGRRVEPGHEHWVEMLTRSDRQR